MNWKESSKLMKKYSTCPDCGSDKVGNGSGSYSIDGETFERKCKCGFKIKIVEGKIIPSHD